MRLFVHENRLSTSCPSLVPWSRWYGYRIYSLISGSWCRSFLPFTFAVKKSESYECSAAANCPDTWTQSSNFPLQLVCSLAFIQKHNYQLSQRQNPSEGRLLSLFKTFHYILKIRVYFQKLPCWLFWMSCQCNTSKVAASLTFRQVCGEEGAVLSSLIPWQKDWDHLTSVWKSSEASYNGLLPRAVISSTSIHEASLKVLRVVFSFVTPELLVS